VKEFIILLLQGVELVLQQRVFGLQGGQTAGDALIGRELGL
jgi:hypothetical protein